MGGIIAYELSYKLKKENNVEPICLFVSGCKAPLTDGNKEKIHDLPEKKFRQKLFEYGGTPKEILQNEELMEVFAPILRRDFEICFNHKYTNIFSLGCDIIGFFGKDEGFSEGEINKWGNYTNRDYINMVYPGGHFFINENMNSIIEVINERLK